MVDFRHAPLRIFPTFATHWHAYSRLGVLDAIHFCVRKKEADTETRIDRAVHFQYLKTTALRSHPSLKAPRRPAEVTSEYPSSQPWIQR